MISHYKIIRIRNSDAALRDYKGMGILSSRAGNWSEMRGARRREARRRSLSLGKIASFPFAPPANGGFLVPPARVGYPARQAVAAVPRVASLRSVGRLT